MKRIFWLLTLMVLFCSCVSKTPEKKVIDYEKLVQEREIYLSQFTERERNAIENETFFVGMSRLALIESLGEPVSIDEIGGSEGISEQFVYSNGEIYIILDNGLVSSFFDIFTEQERKAIKERSIFLGMSRVALIESLGNPDDINETVGSWGVHEQFVYSRYDLYVYVEDGKVTSWQK